MSINNYRDISYMVKEHKEMAVLLLLFPAGILLVSKGSILSHGINLIFQGIVSQIIGVVLLVYSLILVSKYTSKEKSLYDKKVPIKKHPIFIELSREMSKKSSIEEKFLSIKFEVWFNYLKEMVKSNEFTEIDYFEQGSNTLYSYLLKKQEKAIKKYENEWRVEGFTEKTIEDFSKLHNSNLKIINNILSILLNSEFNTDSHSRLVALCNAHLFLSDLSKNSIEKALKDGTLKIRKRLKK